MKFLAILPAALLAASPALAGPYVNSEINAGFSGGDYSGLTFENHVGIDGSAGKFGWYVQAGPAVVAPEGGNTEIELSGKAGGSVAVSEKLDMYGEVSFITAAENGYGTKAGLKYRF